MFLTMMRVRYAFVLIVLVLFAIPVVLAQSSNCVTVDSSSCPAGQVRRGGGTLYNPDGTTKVGSLCCTPVCGDGRKESSEQCDGSGCGSGYSCKSCSCVKDPEPEEASPVPVSDPFAEARRIEQEVLVKMMPEAEIVYGGGEHLPALPSPVESLGPAERAYYRKQCLDSCEASVKPREQHCRAMQDKLQIFLAQLAASGVSGDAADAAVAQWWAENSNGMKRGCEFSLTGCQKYCFIKIPSLPGEPVPKAQQERNPPAEDEDASSVPISQEDIEGPLDRAADELKH